MSKVLITRSKLDGLATTIAAKSGATLPLTIDQMDAAVASIETGGSGSVYQDADGYLVVDDSESSAPQGNISITANGTYDVTDYAGASVSIESVSGLTNKIGTVRFYVSTASSVVGGLWKKGDNWYTAPALSASANNTFDVYAEDGATYVDFCFRTTNAVARAINNAFSFTGDVAKVPNGSYTSYVIRVTGDGSVTYTD